jgi:HEPN domain-containing protein
MQHFLQPFAGFDVEVCGRLVEHQEAGRLHERAGKRQPDLLAASAIVRGLRALQLACASWLPRRVSPFPEYRLHRDSDIRRHTERAAAHLLKLGQGSPGAVVSFHAQQCVEKYLKALLVLKGIEFPRTHDIEKLIELLPLGVPVRLPVAAQRTLTTYGAMTRYPGDYEPVTLAEARQAVAMARRVRRDLRSVLPKARRGHGKQPYFHKVVIKTG